MSGALPQDQNNQKDIVKTIDDLKVTIPADNPNPTVLSLKLEGPDAGFMGDDFSIINVTRDNQDLLQYTPLARAFLNQVALINEVSYVNETTDKDHPKASISFKLNGKSWKQNGAYDMKRVNIFIQNVVKKLKSGQVLLHDALKQGIENEEIPARSPYTADQDDPANRCIAEVFGKYVAPGVSSHGGGVELRYIEKSGNDISVTLDMGGACLGCQSITKTFEGIKDIANIILKDNDLPERVVHIYNASEAKAAVTLK